MLIKTYYNNLNVANNSSSDVIRAAYKAIIQNCEADLSPNADASRFLKTINDSFAVLSNPVQRAEYDQWLIEQEFVSPDKRKLNTTFKSTRKVNTTDTNVASKAVEPKPSLDSSESPISAPTNGTNLSRWLIYTGIFFAILLALKWFGIFDSNAENTSDEIAQISDSATQPETSSLPASSQSSLTQIAENTQSIPMVVATSIPDHDKVSINEFIGLWKGSNGVPAGTQTLDISLKSEHSIVFNLDAKAGQSIGGVYGIAEFANSYANFYNKEYNCSILFTIKSGVLQLNTSSCKAYHESGISFDGQYNKPSLAKTVTKSVAAQSKTPAKNSSVKANQTPSAQTTAAVAINAPQLLKFVATVKDAAGKQSKIELIAKDKEAAKAIIRDFRGNPDIVRIKEVRN